MKYLSLLVFCALLIWSWRQAHSVSGISYETHFSIQEKMAETIVTVIQHKRPTARNIEITKMWTTPLNDNKVEAVFSYKFVEDSEDGETVEMSVMGSAILDKTEETPDQEMWTITDVTTDKDTIVFNQGLTIRPHDTDAPEITEPEKSPSEIPGATEPGSANEK